MSIQDSISIYNREYDLKVGAIVRLEIETVEEYTKVKKLYIAKKLCQEFGFKSPDSIPASIWINALEFTG